MEQLTWLIERQLYQTGTRPQFQVDGFTPCRS